MLKPFLYGLLGGAAVGGLVWWIAHRSLEKELERGGTRLLIAVQPELQSQVRAAIDREVPALVQSTMRVELARVGIDATTGRRLNEALALMERMGAI